LFSSRGKRCLIKALWGWSTFGNSNLINARSETVEKKSVFARAFANGRCLVPADGFFEWKKENRERRPFFFQPATEEPLLFAGLVEQTPGELPKFVILTTEANDVVRPIHSRMPVIIPPDRIDEWFENPKPGIFLPYPKEKIIGFEVSKKVNFCQNQGADCIQKLQ